MSKPDLDIIRSPEAKTFLRMVTEGFYDRSYLALWLFEVMGREWDEMRAWSEELKKEIFVQTCTWSIDIWEWVYGFEPDETMTLEERRQRILNRVRGVRPINPEVLRLGVEELAKADTEVHDFVGPYRFEVIIHPKNSPIPFDKILKYLRDTKPSHLSYDFRILIEAKDPAVIGIGGRLGIQAHIGMAEEANAYEHQETVHVGGLFELRSISGISEKTNDYDFIGTIHAGGYLGGQALLSIEEDTALPPADSTLRAGGKLATRVTLPLPENTSPPPAQSELQTGGTLSTQSVVAIPENSEPPPSISIQRMGTVCNIISNLSQGE